MGATSILTNIFFIFAWISSVRSSDCTLMTSCTGLQQMSFIVTDIQSTAQVRITCDMTSTALRGWSQSPDGSASSILLNTSSTKYTVDGNALTINNINRTDEGLYRCIYEQGQRDENCIYVYGRAVFASCLLDFDGCTANPTQLSVTAGGSVNLNATVTHIAGGSCGFVQEITLVQLTKINEAFSINNQLLLLCRTSSSTCSSGRVSLDRGRDPGIEFVFTLSDTNANDAGTYEVAMEVVDPNTGSQTMIEKKFHLEVNAVTETTPGSDATARSTPVLDGTDSSMHTSVPSTVPRLVTVRESIIPVVVPSAVGALAVIITAIVTIAVVCVVYFVVRKKPSGSEVDNIPVNPNPTYHHSSNIVSREENVRNNTQICVNQSPDIVDANNKEGNEQGEYATVPLVKAQLTKERHIESDYIAHNMTLRNPHLNSSPQQVTLFGETSNNHEYV